LPRAKTNRRTARARVGDLSQHCRRGRMIDSLPATPNRKISKTAYGSQRVLERLCSLSVVGYNSPKSGSGQNCPKCFGCRPAKVPTSTWDRATTGPHVRPSRGHRVRSFSGTRRPSDEMTGRYFEQGPRKTGAFGAPGKSGSGGSYLPENRFRDNKCYIACRFLSRICDSPKVKPDIVVPIKIVVTPSRAPLATIGCIVWAQR